MKSRNSFFIITGIIVLLFSSCGFDPNAGRSEADFENSTDTISSVETDTVNFEANQSTSLGSGFWNIPDTTDQQPFLILEVSAKKESGYDLGQYGVIICYQDDSNYYLLTIDTEGNFQFDKMENDVLQNLVTNTFTGNLTTGYDVYNKIKIERDGSSKFTFTFNDLETTNITDTTFTGGSSGYFVYIGSEQNENFPSVPVVVSFTKMQIRDLK